MRKPIIAGNWKMNKTPDEARELVNALKPLVKDASVDVVVCPPFVCIPAVAEAVKGSNIKVGAQNVHFEKSGAFTAEVSVDMLKALGVEGKALIVTAEADDKVIKSAANIPGVKTAAVNTLNVYDILNYDKFIVVKNAVGKIEEVYA